MNLAYFYAANLHSVIVTLILVALAIWLIFYVLPLPQPVRTILAVGIAVLLILWLIPGCATDTGDPKKDRQGRVTNAVLQDVFNIALQGAMSAGAAALQGQNGQDAANAAFESAALSGGVNLIGDAITAYAGPQAKPIAVAAQKAVALASPQTPADKAAVLNTIGAAIQQAANQTP